MTTKTYSMLSDPEFIQWAQRNEWSPTEAIILLLGMCPPNRELPSEELCKLHEAAQYLLAMREEYGEIWSNHPANWTVSASEMMRSDIHPNWIAIYVGDFPNSLASMFGEQPDYNRFIAAVAFGHMLPLGELVRFAQCIGEKVDTTFDREYNDAVAAMVSRLQIRPTNIDDSQNALVDAKRFIDLYPGNLFAVDSRYTYWLEWSNNHQEVLDWLAGRRESERETGENACRPIVNKSIINGPYHDEAVSAAIKMRRDSKTRAPRYLQQLYEYMLQNRKRFPMCCDGLTEWESVKQRVYREKRGNPLKNPRYLDTT